MCPERNHSHICNCPVQDTKAKASLPLKNFFILLRHATEAIALKAVA